MLSEAFSKFQITAEYPISVTAGTFEEGNFLEGILENGVFVVRPSTGTSGPVFAGVAWGYFSTPATAPIVDLLTVDASAYTAVLSQVPTSTGAIQVYLAVLNTANNEYEPGTVFTQIGSAPLTTQYTISGNTLTFNSANGGVKVYALYRYNLTVQQAEALVGDVISIAAPAVTNSIGIIERGKIFTSCFDTSIDWTTNPATIKLGASGNITVGGSGATINARVYALPTADVPFLGVQFDTI
jgi:hypothetical protein